MSDIKPQNNQNARKKELNQFNAWLQPYCTAITARAKLWSQSKRFTMFYSLLAISVLIGTTAVWSYLGARLQQANADQLADPLLFGSPDVFRGAAFPAQHSFLIKWPLFYLIKLAHYSVTSFTVATVATAVLTVLLFALLLRRIDRRPLVFGTLCLALASCLLLVPAQPYAGALLPVNMAMVTTRNLEYIVFLASLVVIARRPRFNGWRFWLAVVLLAGVSASDRLFLDISLAGSVAALIVYGLRQRWKLVSLSVDWLLISLTAGAVALSGLWIINAMGTTHIVGQSSTSPYAVVHSAKTAATAGVFAVMGLFTNFGANPAYDAGIIREIPQRALTRLLSPSGISYLINACVLLYGLWIASKFLLASLLKSRARAIKPSTSFRLTLILLWTALADLAVFVASNHDYAVDSRYLTIWLFTIFVALASYASKKKPKPEQLLGAALLLCIALGAAIPQLVQTQRSGQGALADINLRNKQVYRALQTHRTSTLVGDYWRVLPIQLAGAPSDKTRVVADPIADCTQPRTVLTSDAWQPELRGHRFAYLLSFDASLTDFPHCNLDQVTKQYGRPNATELIAGTLAKPTELLLFYDQGINKIAPAAAITTILPISPEELVHTSCPVPTDMNIVAHEDDDLLFMNPDTQHEIQAGHCVRTVYITAGDDGQGRGYWLSREQGSEAAYSAMTGNKQPWVRRVVRLKNHEYVTVANPKGNNQVSLIFFRLPDGGLTGQGFGSTHAESLPGLYRGTVSTIHSVDNQSLYTSDELTTALSDLLATYQPSTIHTQSSYSGTQFKDHTDHEAVGLFVQRAYAKYEQQQFENSVTVPIKYYLGYPIRERPINLERPDIGQKQAVFLQYSLFDNAVCRSAIECEHTSTYGSYLKRQYQNPY